MKFFLFIFGVLIVPTSLLGFSNANSLVNVTSCLGCHQNAASFVPEEFDFAWIEDERLFGSIVYEINIDLPEDNLPGRNGYQLNSFDSSGNPVGSFVKSASGEDFEEIDFDGTVRVQGATMALVDEMEESQLSVFWKSPVSGALPESIQIQVYAIDGLGSGPLGTSRYAEAFLNLELPKADDEEPPPVQETSQQANESESANRAIETSNSCRLKMISPGASSSSPVLFLLFVVLLGLRNMRFHRG